MTPQTGVTAIAVGTRRGKDEWRVSQLLKI